MPATAASPASVREWCSSTSASNRAPRSSASSCPHAASSAHRPRPARLRRSHCTRRTLGSAMKIWSAAEPGLVTSVTGAPTAAAIARICGRCQIMSPMPGSGCTTATLLPSGTAKRPGTASAGRTKGTPVIGANHRRAAARPASRAGRGRVPGTSVFGEIDRFSSLPGLTRQSTTRTPHGSPGQARG